MNTQKSFSVSKWIFLTSARLILGIVFILLFVAFSEYSGIDVQFPLAISMGLVLFWSLGFLYANHICYFHTLSKELGKNSGGNY